MKAIDKFKQLVDLGVSEGAYPGANFAIIFKDKIIYGSHGYKSLYPEKEVNDINTIYDMASLSKVVSTTTCALKLIEEGKLRVYAPVKKYIPEFKHEGVTVWNLMTHTSGLPEGLPGSHDLTEQDNVWEKILNVDLRYETNMTIKYSDLGYITLGKVIESISGKKLNEFAKEEIFDKLNMVDTGYLPSDKMRCAPTELREDKVYNGYLRGRVHDETAFALGGVAGHAGLFSTIKDTSIFLQMLLNNGVYEGKQFLSQATIDLLYTPQVEEKVGVRINDTRRTLGWINRGAGSSAGELTSDDTILHTGFTGTNIWVDRKNEVAFAFFTNRVHPTRKNLLHMDVRARLANFVIAHKEELRNE